MIREDHDQAPGRGPLLGACNGLAQRTGLNPNLVRVGAIVAACIWFKLTVALYCLAAVAFRLQRR